MTLVTLMLRDPMFPLQELLCLEDLRPHRRCPNHLQSHCQSYLAVPHLVQSLQLSEVTVPVANYLTHLSPHLSISSTLQTCPQEVRQNAILRSKHYVMHLRKS